MTPIDHEFIRGLEFVTNRTKLITFIEESNRIERIKRKPLPIEISAHEVLLERRKLDVEDLVTFVGLVSDGELRERPGRNVWIGGAAWRPPPGGPLIRAHLDLLLAQINHTGDKEWPGAVLTPWEAHCRYETLHPFTDGNGRSGRALWAWQMLRLERDPFIRPFLHSWYYESLNAAR